MSTATEGASRSSSSRHSRKEVCAWIWRTETAMMMMWMMMMMTMMMMCCECVSGGNGRGCTQGTRPTNQRAHLQVGWQAFVVPSASSQERPNDSIS